MTPLGRTARLSMVSGPRKLYYWLTPERKSRQKAGLNIALDRSGSSEKSSCGRGSVSTGANYSVEYTILDPI